MQSNFRHEFVSNASPFEHEQQYRQPPPPPPPLSYPTEPNNNPLPPTPEDFVFNEYNPKQQYPRPYIPSSPSNIRQAPPPPTVLDEYELSNLKHDNVNINQRQLSATNEPLINPFRSDNDLHNEYRYHNSSNSGQDPFNEHSNAFSNDKPPHPPVSEELTRLQRNEKNRRRQLRRKPRFHYTKLPYFIMIATLIQLIVFIVELVKMRVLTGSAFQTKPYFNPMLGPSTYLLINMGARYVPCMHEVLTLTNDTTIQFPCPNSTSTETNVCSLAELCGLNGIPIKNNVYVPDQWYRVFIPIFLHAGFLHIIFNLLLQLTVGLSIERAIGWIKFALIYIASGIAGFLLGSNFSPDGIASTGCSGALFGIMATNILMFVYCGRKNANIYGTTHYVTFICIMIAEIVVSFVLGLLPGLDNFSHIGGFAMGLLTGIVLLPDPFFVYIDGIITYTGTDSTWQSFVNNWNPMHHWEDKIASRVYMWIGARALALILVIIYFALLFKNFYGTNDTGVGSCKWCKYLNCLPVHGWCDIGTVTVETTDSTPSSSQSTFPSATETTEVLPSSIENGNDHSQFRKRNSFEDLDYFRGLDMLTNDAIHEDLHLEGNPSFMHEHNVGIGFYIVVAFLSFAYFKRRRGH